MRIQNDFDCRPISCGHVYEKLNRTGWMTVTNYEVSNGLFLNLMYSDIDEFVNQDLVGETNYLALALMLRGAAEFQMEGTRVGFIPGAALFGAHYNKRMKMTVNTRRCTGLSLILSADASIGTLGDDPGLDEVLEAIRTKLGTGMNRLFRIPLEVAVLQESLLLELERNRCRDADYIGKRASQILHVLYRMPGPEWVEVPDVSDNLAVDRAVFMMTEDLSRRRTVREVCESLGIDEFWFINNFRRRYGMTPTGYVMHIRHIRSAAMLLAGHHKVSEVAENVGYSSKSMFLKAFRKINGCNPSEYVDNFDRMIEAYPGKA